MQDSVAIIGFFDGVHLGHSFVINQLRQVAAANMMQSVIITFSNHPLQVLCHAAPPLLTTTDERQKRLLETGVDKLIILPFEDIHQLTAMQFMQRLYDDYAVRVLLLGYDHRFGSDRLTTFSQYKDRADRVGMKVVRLEAFTRQNEHISSTHIRQLLLDGQVEAANRLLGYEFGITGVVEHGKGIGRSIGFPTANLRVEPQKLIPMDGVYEVRVIEIAGCKIVKKGLLNIGTNPTVGGSERTVELFIVDYEGDLYGSQVSLQLQHFLRREKRFDSIVALNEQMQRDLDQIST